MYSIAYLALSMSSPDGALASKHLIARVDPRFRTLHRKSRGIHDPEGMIADFAVHHTHNLVNTSGTGMRDLYGESEGHSVSRHLRAGDVTEGTDHLDQSHRGDFDSLEVMRTAHPVSRGRSAHASL